jgi:hypothetical protein
MDIEGAGLTQVDLTRRPGQRSGCSCCSSFMVIGLVGLVVLPALAAVMRFTAHRS